MSRAREVASSLLAVLDEEREAIRRLDGPAVSATALRKAALAAALATLPPSDLEPARADLAKLRAELRRNGTLLAHARSCLRDIVEIATGNVGASKVTNHLRARL